MMGVVKALIGFYLFSLTRLSAFYLATLSHHRRHDGGIKNLNLSDDLKAMPEIQRDIFLVTRFQISHRAFVV